MARTPEEILAELEVELRTYETSTDTLQQWNLNYLKNHTSRFLSDFRTLKQYYKEGDILELGSAPLHFTYLLKKSGLPVVGADIDPGRFAEFVDTHNLDVRKCNVETDTLPFDTGAFHIILFNEIFEHMRINPIATLKEIRRVLHPEGYLILSTPNLYSVTTFVNFILGKGFDDPYEQFDKLEKYGHMGHVREYTVGQVKKFLVKTGFQPVEVTLQSHRPLKGMWTPFNLVRWAVPTTRAFQTHICKPDQ